MVLVLVGVWWLARGGRPAAVPSSEPAADDVAAPPSPAGGRRAAPDPAPAAPVAERAVAPPPPEQRAPAPLVTPDAGAELTPSHPITPAHIRIQRENALLGAMNGAMDVEDGAGLRNLLDQYRQEFPDDPNQQQEGYAIIADCLQHPGSASTAAGQRYFDRERGSILRRFVARHCQLQLP